jgi:hypothetical protein
VIHAENVYTVSARIFDRKIAENHVLRAMKRHRVTVARKHVARPVHIIFAVHLQNRAPFAAHNNIGDIAAAEEIVNVPFHGTRTGSDDNAVGENYLSSRTGVNRIDKPLGGLLIYKDLFSARIKRRLKTLCGIRGIPAEGRGNYRIVRGEHAKRDQRKNRSGNQKLFHNNPFIFCHYTIFPSAMLTETLTADYGIITTIKDGERK